MITIIHGDDILESRKFFQELKLKQKNFVLFSGGKITITDLVQNIKGSGLFGDTKSLFIEDLLSKLKKTEKATKEMLNFIAENVENSNFVLWESKEILKRDLSLFKNAVVKLFKLPKKIFLFLDNLKPQNSKNLLSLFHQTLDSGVKEELILFMIQRQFRILLSLCDLDPSADREGSQIDEVLRLAPWQMEKLKRQAELFDMSGLIRVYKKLYEIEIAQKTGSSSLSLTQNIDILLLEM